mgnify:CR=1 FL=1
MIDNPNIRDLAKKILGSRKYKELGIPIDTVINLLGQELPRHKSSKQALHIVRKKLHLIVAPYLGDLDYDQAQRELKDVFRTQDKKKIITTCHDLLSQHTSTRERLPYLSEFYKELFQRTGKPQTILDLACGLNPLALPWMNLPAKISYYAYDIHQPRVALINRFFKLSNLPQLAEVRDVLLAPPKQHADIAFFFKEAHRLEHRQHGSNRKLWSVLDVRYLLVSLPCHSLSGRFNLKDKMKKLVHDITNSFSWKVEEFIINDEIVFIIEK